MIRIKPFMTYSFLFVFCLAASSAAHAEILKIGVATKTHSIPVILVHGDKNGYSKILTDKLTYHIYTKMNYPKKSKGPSFGYLRLGGKPTAIEPNPETTTYEITIPYKNPSGDSPVKKCNAWLKTQTGDKKEKALKEGTRINIQGAYRATANASYKQKKGAFWNNEEAYASIDVPVGVRCIGLNAPAPRKGHSTKQRERETKAKHLSLYKLTLEAKPGDQQKINGQICPTKAYLYGKIKAYQPVEGSAVLFGPGYISPITKVDIPKDGQSTVRGTYPIDWSSDGSSELTVDNSKPNTKKFDITFNLSNKDNKVIKSTGKKTFTVTCKKPKVNPAVRKSVPKAEMKGK